LTSGFVRVNVDGNQFMLVLKQCDLERIEDEANPGFFMTMEGNEFLAEGFSKVVFLCEEGRTHANLKGSSTNDSGTLEAGVGSCWLDHGVHLRANSQSAD
jgi:hypothetical protein